MFTPGSVRRTFGPGRYATALGGANEIALVSPAGELSNFSGYKPALFLCHVDELGPTRARRAKG
jgi:hypothetical protein